ncbi:hypothetical protein ALC57_10786 [Trachymyrmex cornetzi]|uniref:CCHC-type domain-containing protein n=1 Tax=Trachymyrmex cornetzi TaxID=471704 RepID=A0A151J3H8_9HYME|nr:hypothetical protein ALC57_10786 [Trachymyrmex cornetzi]
MHPIIISSIVAKSGIPDIQEIKKIGRGKILIEAKSATAANRLVDNPAFTKHNLKAFIPAFRVLREGVIQDVPTELELDYIRRNIESPGIKILEIFREVFLFKTRHEVRPFIPKSRICFKCYRAEHVAKVCKSSPRCLYCENNVYNAEEPCP